MRGLDAPLFMKISLCKTESIANKVDKKFDIVEDLENAKFVDNVTILSPKIRTSIFKNVSLLKNNGINYVYIPSLKRYYFIRDIEFTKDGFIDFFLDIDILMSYKDDILNSSQIINRAENLVTPMLIDTDIPLQQNLNVTNYNLDNDILYTNYTNFVLKLGGNY